MKKLNYNFLNCAKQMPRLNHNPDGNFDIEKSEVINWLIKQPSIKQKIFDMAANNKVIYFKDGKWQGVDYEQH